MLHVGIYSSNIVNCISDKHAFRKHSMKNKFSRVITPNFVKKIKKLKLNTMKKIHAYFTNNINVYTSMKKIIAHALD